ncbi:hypothetical protein CYMTET_27935 [Cymbomonas tetramitiformis]|uniref:Uncharacterized protein n=1 Tax=Cymbomonas tetramitiformis TaxID=36881 RepID=A0AAE0FP61_9CHLO|nr:hypothetical protein CYMTET_27935 [Cymbomonas tetramitiformis]
MAAYAHRPQRAAVDLNTIRLWTRQCYASNVRAGVTGGLSAATLTVDTGEKSAIADLTSIILDLQRQVKSLSSRMDDTNTFTPRGAKPRGKKTRFAARDLPAGGNWSQTQQRRRVAFHKGTGEFMPFCANDTCALGSARHWHRDCPNGGKAANKKEFGSHSFTVSDFENDMYAEQFQCAVEEGDSDIFNALCFLVLYRGEPAEMRDKVSASPLVVPLRHSETQGFCRYRVVPLPPALQDPDLPVSESPPYSPPPYTSDEEEETSTDDFDIENPSISPPRDVPAAPQLPFGCPMDMVRAGPTIPPPVSGSRSLA